MSSDQGRHLHVYGIRNCDGCRFTLKWLEARNVPHTFHDFRVEGLSAERLKDWLATAHAPALVNKRSTTWRQLAEAQKRLAQTDPLALLQAKPTLIKRPVITDGDAILDIGFAPARLEAFL